MKTADTFRPFLSKQNNSMQAFILMLIPSPLNIVVHLAHIHSLMNGVYIHASHIPALYFKPS